MKKQVLFVGLALVTWTAVSCKKNQCRECHYDDATGAEVELGKKCGDELETLEAYGYNLDGTNYVVHCHEH